jgi:hypothetical protein
MACQDCKKTSVTSFTTKQFLQLLVGLYIIGSTIYSTVQLSEWFVNFFRI